MRFRYKDDRGKVTVLPDVASLVTAIRDGAITPDTQFAAGDEGHFQQAEQVVAFQQASAAIAGSPRKPAGQVPAAKTTSPAGRIARYKLGIAAAVLLGALAIWRIRTLDLQHSVAVSAVPTGPSLVTRSAVAGMATEFGDSAAVAQHRLANWIESQHLPDRFRGGALRIGASLRTVRSAATRYRREIDSLLVRSRSFAQMLVQRADSAEASDPGLDGLMVAVEDVLVEWQHDLAQYADIQRTAALTLDSLATFVLGRQQSFAIREGQPVFLSRQDAVRFRELTDNLSSLARREKAWADALTGRWPGWMTALAEGERPHFGRSLISGPASN